MQSVPDFESTTDPNGGGGAASNGKSLRDCRSQVHPCELLNSLPAGSDRLREHEEPGESGKRNLARRPPVAAPGTLVHPPDSPLRALALRPAPHHTLPLMHYMCRGLTFPINVHKCKHAYDLLIQLFWLELHLQLPSKFKFSGFVGSSELHMMLF